MGVHCWWRGGLGFLLAACAPPPVTPQPPRPAPPPAQQVKFCAGTVTVNQVHRCIWELTPEQQRHRSYSQRLLFNQGRFERMDTVMGSGAPHLRDTSFVFSYRGEQVSEYTQENRNGVLVGRNVYGEQHRSIRWLDEQDRPSCWPKGSRISGELLEFDAPGRVRRARTVDAQGAPTPDGKVYERRIARNAIGAIYEKSFFGATSEPVTDKWGVHRTTYELDEHGSELVRRHFDAQGEPALVQNAAVVRSEYDEYGNPAKTSYFDADDRPTRGGEHQAAALRFTRDARGNEIQLELLNEQGRPLAGKDGFATRLRTVDELDRTIEERYFSETGAPVPHLGQGCARSELQYDQRSNVTSEQCLDQQGAPTLGKRGYFRLEYSYDRRDNPITLQYLDLAGAPETLKAGYAVEKRFYDGDRHVRSDFLDAHGKPVMIDKGYASFEVPYLEDGSAGEKRFLDASGLLLPSSCSASVPEELQQEIGQRAAETATCYGRLLAKSPKAAGRLVVELRIDAHGRVLSSAVVEDGLGAAVLTSCTLAILKEPYLSRPEGGDCAIVRVPLRFEPKQP
jgi:hypothetical protein